ncbi:MAG: hypothetical protein AMXMBFR44_0360 [Candidatus Campbellbacteria bacterium]
MRTVSYAALSLALMLSVGFISADRAFAQTDCGFTRDLSLGDQGEDIRCLQKYLNGAGFTVATEGPGAPGGETSLYREKTVAAVKRWQEAKGISPATGTWGPLSRLTYQKAILSSAVGAQKPTTGTVTAPTVVQPTQSAAEKAARSKLLAALNAIDDAQDEYDDAREDGDGTGDAGEMLEDARDALFDALRAFLEGEYDDAADDASRARNDADDASDEIEGELDDDDERAEEELDEVEQELEDARDDVNDEEDEGEDVDEAEDLLDEAEELFEDAQDAYDDDDFDDVLDLVDEIRDLIEEALDSI